MSAERNEQQTRSSGNAVGTSGARPRPALDPLSPTLTQPNKDLVGKGIIAELYVTFTPMGTQVRGKASLKLAEVEGSGLNTTDYFPLALLSGVAEKGGLSFNPRDKKKSGGQGPAQVKPAKTLVPADLDGSLNEAALQNRINAIAKACGGGPLVGRVRSEGAFQGSETTSYRDWWDAAPAPLRALSLTEGKRRKELTPDHVGKLANLQCPFRGALEFEVAAGDEEEEVQASSSKPTATSAGKQSPKK